MARGSAGELGVHVSILEGKVDRLRSIECPKAIWEYKIKDWTGLSTHTQQFNVPKTANKRIPALELEDAKTYGLQRICSDVTQ